jgi:DNA polymerase III alpha subunit
MLPSFPEYDFRYRLALEMEILDLTVSAHPLALHAERVARVRARRPTVRSVDLKDHAGETIYVVGWYVTGKLTSVRPFSALDSKIPLGPRSARDLGSLGTSGVSPSSALDSKISLGPRSARDLGSLGTSGQQGHTLMKFVTFSDEWGRFEVTFFPKAYQRMGLELEKGKGPFLIKGTVELELGVETLTATDMAYIGGKT